MQDNTAGGISIPGSKQKDKEEKEAAHSAGIGPSKATPSASRWQPIAVSPAKNEKSAAKQSDTFALGDDDDE